ncbi:MAG: hypothetical protein ONB42_11155 [candidate division KSB1 bacterium]|nr:hypothetical protein [candidate division KSB1 bacterium]MDZ7310919.1 hypothetical protein [candidate division KSB1 bacterium]
MWSQEHEGVAPLQRGTDARGQKIPRGDLFIINKDLPPRRAAIASRRTDSSVPELMKTFWGFT